MKEASIMFTLVIAEDDSVLRENLSLFLLQEGYKVLAAANGISAYRLILTYNPDLIISDMHMPLMGGFELIKKLRINPSTASIPVVCISSESDDSLEMEGKALGIRAFLMKPFNLNDLLDLIKKYTMEQGEPV